MKILFIRTIPLHLPVIYLTEILDGFDVGHCLKIKSILTGIQLEETDALLQIHAGVFDSCLKGGGGWAWVGDLTAISCL